MEQVERQWRRSNGAGREIVAQHSPSICLSDIEQIEQIERQREVEGWWRRAAPAQEARGALHQDEGARRLQDGVSPVELLHVTLIISALQDGFVVSCAPRVSERPARQVCTLLHTFARKRTVVQNDGPRLQHSRRVVPRAHPHGLVRFHDGECVAVGWGGLAFRGGGKGQHRLADAAI